MNEDSAALSGRIHVAQRREQTGFVSLDAVISEAGVYFTLISPGESATSSIIPWRTLTQIVISRDPDLFGAIEEPLHQGFVFAMRDLGFIVPRVIGSDDDGPP
ncbi:MAG: hypothetical protein Q7T05_04880 [Dehalococcoidia bacterium]|nr:hypothetical protein [Dehalococcoidia bacterium]